MLSGMRQRMLATSILCALAAGCTFKVSSIEVGRVDNTKTESIKAEPPVILGCNGTICSPTPVGIDPSPAVKITITAPNMEGHGSGVYIGNGAILTAAHVATVPGTMQVIDDAGNKYAAEVLWTNTKYDVAMIAVKGAKMSAASVDCAPVKVGDSVSTTGNPGGEDFLTFWGRVAGKARKSDPWASVFLADIRGTGGESGGPVYNAYGEVAGILVGGMIGLAYSDDNGKVDLSQTGITYVVPSSTVCKLMGRRV